MTITVIGWGTAISNPSDIALKVGDLFATGIVIVSSSTGQTIITAVSPSLSSAGKFQGSAKYANLDARFSWECFMIPTMSVSPRSVPVNAGDGQGGLIVTLDLSEFPTVQTNSDVQVSFGQTICSGSASTCSVTSFRNWAGGVTVAVSVPTAASAGVVELQATFVGKHVGDTAATHVRTVRTATSEFTFFVPTPKVVATLWCAECVSAVGSGLPCILAGRCGGTSRPLPSVGRAPINGGGVLTIYVDNVPPVPFDPATRALVSPGTVSVHYASSFPTLRQIAFVDASQSAFEFVLPSATTENVGTAQAIVKVQADSSMSQKFSANFDLQLYDQHVTLKCIPSPCAAPSKVRIPHKVFAAPCYLSY